jgi:hypothetical protein
VLACSAPDLDCSGGAYQASAWLDCTCHANSPERQAAIALETALRTIDPLDVDPELLQAVTATSVLAQRNRHRDLPRTMRVSP